MSRKRRMWRVESGEYGARGVHTSRRYCEFTTHHAPLTTHHSSGYTLVEMLIVVTIVGLMASVVLPTLNSASGAVSLEAMARTLAADLRIARHSAVQYNSNYSVTWNLTNNSYSVAQAYSGGAPGVVNVLSHGTSGNTIDLDQFGAGRMGQSRVVIGGAALKVSKSSVTNIVFGPSGGTGPTRTQDTVIWLQENTNRDRRSILLTVSWITGAVTVGDIQQYPAKLTQPVF